MNDLSHIYFAGQDQGDLIGPVRRSSAVTGRTGGRTSGHVPRQESRVGAPASSEALAPYLQLILRRSGLDPSDYQPKALNRRFSACLRAVRAVSEGKARLELERNPEFLRSSLSALLIGVSHFFRDASVFESLRKKVLPQALVKNRGLHIYSAGCAAGQELYSVAVILDELGGLEGSRLLGVDCRHEAIEQARSGCFAVCDLKGVEGPVKRYFQIDGNQARISPKLKRKTAWRVADFGRFRANEPCDVILFRNSAIYLETEYANRVWQQLDSQLKPGGVLVTGTAERPPENLCFRRESACIYHKRHQKAL